MSLLNKKLLLAAGCNNILKKNLHNHTTQIKNVSTDWTNKWETRRFYLQLTYYFGGPYGTVYESFFYRIWRSFLTKIFKNREIDIS